MRAREDGEIHVGFMPLFDSAVLVVASELGFAAREGVKLKLHRETSWANIRDRMAIGHFDMAHMLAPMPIASNLGLAPIAAQTVAPFALALGGNGITVSNGVWSGMVARGAIADAEPTGAGKALSSYIQARAADGLPPLRFGVTHPHSGHFYELCYWLAGSGVDPMTQVEIVIVPPPFMSDALVAGRIDGYCVGEPWNTLSVARGVGHIATVKALIWRNSPEKVIGVGKAFADTHGDELSAVLRALHHASRWCQSAENLLALAELMSRPQFVGLEPALMQPMLTGRLDLGSATRQIEDFFLPFDKAAGFPWKSHALWYYSQMVRWGQIEHSAANAEIARDTYRPDLYRAALKPLGVALPGANAKVEGALSSPTPVGSAGASLVLGPDGFFDGAIFDPDQVDAYVETQKDALQK